LFVAWHSSRNLISPQEEKIMLKRLLSLTLAVLLLHAVNATPVLAFAQASQGERRVEKVKANVAKRAGKKSRVTVKLQDGSKLKGSITQAGEDSFTLTDSRTGQTSTLAYQDVTEVKGQGLSLTAKILIVAGIALVVFVIVVVVGITSTGLGSGPIIGGL
jgi:Flp pilus assembly protein TadB